LIFFAGCRLLEEVTLVSIAVIHFGLAGIAGLCPELKVLTVSGLVEADPSFEAIARMSSKLQQLTFGCGFFRPQVKLSDQTLRMLLQNCKQLEVLKIQDESIWTDAAFSDLGASPFLKTIHLDQQGLMTDVALYALSASCQNLTDLWITNCSKFTHRGIAAVGMGCAALRAVKISSCEGIKSEFVVALAQSCRSLEALEFIKDVAELDDATINTIARNFPRLRRLALSPAFSLPP
jgi:hypothetical protein